MTMDRITARGMFFCGFSASPPTWMACSNPATEKTIPSGSAAKIPWKPKGANPPPAVKLDPWNAVAIKAMIVMTGTRTFHITATELVSDSQRTPRVLITENTSMNPAPSRMPLASSVPLALTMFRLVKCELR